MEATGIPTITLGNARASMERIRPPRWVHVRFPRGVMFGEPGNKAKQRAVLEGVLRAACTIREPGGVEALPFRWEAPPVQWRGREITEGP